MKKASQNKSTIGDKANAPFPTRLRLLLEREHMTQGDLAELLNIARQSANQYCLGLFSPDPEKLCKIAQHFGVTTDYLLGLTDVSSAELNMKMACDFTGLSEKAIAQLRSLNGEVYYSEEYPQVTPLATLSEMMSQGENFTNFMDYIMQGYVAYIEYRIQIEKQNSKKITAPADADTIEEFKQAKNILAKNGYSCFPNFNVSELYFLQAMTGVKIICDDLGEQAQSLIEEMKSKK